MLQNNTVSLLTLLAFTTSTQALNVKSSRKVLKTIVAGQNFKKMTQATKEALYFYLAQQMKTSPEAAKVTAECLKIDIEVNILELKKRLTK